MSDLPPSLPHEDLLGAVLTEPGSGPATEYRGAHGSTVFSFGTVDTWSSLTREADGRLLFAEHERGTLREEVFTTDDPEDAERLVLIRELGALTRAAGTDHPWDLAPFPVPRPGVQRTYAPDTRGWVVVVGHRRTTFLSVRAHAESLAFAEVCDVPFDQLVAVLTSNRPEVARGITRPDPEPVWSTDQLADELQSLGDGIGFPVERDGTTLRFRWAPRPPLPDDVASPPRYTLTLRLLSRHRHTHHSVSFGLASEARRAQYAFDDRRLLWPLGEVLAHSGWTAYTTPVLRPVLRMLERRQERRGSD